MLRRMIISAAVLVAALAGAAGPAQSEVRINLGINLPGPPALVAVPDMQVMYAPGVSANYFFYGGQYYVYNNGGWYVSRQHNGPWAVVAPEYVPRPILTVPVRYYRHAPGEWRHASRGGPPPWAHGWGRRWDGEHGPRHDDHRRG